MLDRRRFLHLTGAAMAAPTIGLSGEGALARAASQTALLRLAKEVAGRMSGPLRLLLPNGSEANVGPVARGFAEAVGVEVAYAFTDVDEINTKILTDRLIGAETFDVALPATFGIPDLAEAGALLPLDEFEARYGAMLGAHDGLYPIGDRFLGDLYGFQTDGDVYVMFYRASWMDDPETQARFEDRLGRPLAIPRTWPELDQTMAFFHQPDRDRHGGALFRTPGYAVWEWWMRLHANGAWPVSDDFEPHVNGEAGVAALEAVVASTAHQHPSAMTNGLFDNWKAYASANIFGNIGWGGSQKHFNRADSPIRGDLRYAMTPGGARGGVVTPMPYFNWGWNYTVSATSRAPELSYLFCRYAVCDDVSARAIRPADGFFDPFLAAHYADADLAATYDPAFLDVHRRSMVQSIPDFYVRGKGEYFNALRENIARAFRGAVSAREALDLAAVQWRQITERLGQEGQTRQWASLKAKYPAAVRQFIDTA